MSSNAAFVLDETDYVWSALNFCTTKCQLRFTYTPTHTHAFVKMKAKTQCTNSNILWHFGLDIQLVFNNIQTHVHIYLQCSFFVCVGVEKGICFLNSTASYNLNYKRDLRIKVSSYCNSLASCGYIRAGRYLFNYNTLFALLKGLHLLLFKKGNLNQGGTAGYKFRSPHKQQGLYVMPVPNSLLAAVNKEGYILVYVRSVYIKFLTNNFKAVQGQTEFQSMCH